jgi:hypothetical protein
MSSPDEAEAKVEAALDTILMLEKYQSDDPVWQIAMNAAQKTYEEATSELDELEYEGIYRKRKEDHAA